MCGWWLNILMIVITLTSANSFVDLDSAVSSARCRAACLLKMEPPQLTDPSCRRSLICSQCWKVRESGVSLCGTSDCGPGSPNIVSPVPLEEVLVFNDSRVSWPSVSGPVVYVVMAGGSSLCQTLQLSAHLPSTVDLATVRVLVVDWRGLVKVFTPVAESPVDHALHILRSVGMEDMPGFLFRGNSEHIEGAPVNLFIPKNVWKIKVESLHQQPPLVKGTISWRGYHHQLLLAKQMTSYLVTWAMDGGLLRGSLLTNTSSVVLSLLPDTLYTVQVSTLDQRTSSVASEMLVLDTHSSFTEANNLPSSYQRNETQPKQVASKPLQHTQRFDGTTTAVVFVFLGLIAGSIWRWRSHNFSLKKKLVYERIDCPEI